MINHAKGFACEASHLPVVRAAEPLLSGGIDSPWALTTRVTSSQELTLNGGTLTFPSSGRIAYDAMATKKAGLDFTVTLTSPAR